MGSNISKPYQAQWITRVGFHIPPTLVTNDPEAVRSFLEAHGKLIYKSTSSVRSIVQELDETRFKDLYRTRYLPTQFQAFVPGVNIRVHVVGDTVFASEILSEALDYRYADRDGHEVSMVSMVLPTEIEARCRALSQALGLPLCGIDLKRTPSGSYYCFEVNPSPAYSYYEEQTGQPISFAIVNYLNGSKEVC
jgi:glutathione synthase/RimK-type ligase-like ATP-grasp enzyme